MDDRALTLRSLRDRKRFREGRGVPHEDFWSQAAAENTPPRRHRGEKTGERNNK